MDIVIIPKCSSSDSDSNHDDHANKNANFALVLSQDLMFHIFTLIPPKCLLSSVRYVCKPWADAIASSHFAEACQCSHARSKPGLYVENHKSHINSYFLEFKDDVNGRFERTELGTPKSMGCVVGSCDGILLLSSSDKQLFVVNPGLKWWLRIPPLPASKGFSHRCTIARVPRTAKFKLFFVDVHMYLGAFWYVFYVLRVGIDNSWKEIARKQAPLRYYLSWKPLCRGDNDLYWMTIEGIIVMDVDKEIIVREYLFHGPPIKYLWMENHLSCIMSNDSYRTYRIYSLDFDSGKWSLYHKMGPFDYMAACGRNLNTEPVIFSLWIKDQIIFRVGLSNNPDKIENMYFGYNVKTKQLSKIEDIDAGDFEVWLHTNSLVSLR
ncbi:unnamed protein product [Lathyrus sativus]|nr:unnamed protein product [Lathyrus sativus]